ncbi:phosphatase [Paenibacillus sp. 481]|uniref:phosphatase n=1 Tax=Paenibacillus sp. 481 TaxID=2835869 RepID=UPI001E4E13E4|nr:phosphatase [Paenibacillus sp. 481]UHA72098.1 phosphatase [Paenibacillus sp. 481]
MSVHHKMSWASLGAAIVVTVYYASVLFHLHLKGDIGLYSAEMTALARNVFGIAIVFQAIAMFIKFMSKDELPDKQFARQVSYRANQKALLFLVLAVACCAAYLINLSGRNDLYLSPLVGAHLLVSVLLAAWMIKHGMELLFYFRDRKKQSTDDFQDQF